MDGVLLGQTMFELGFADLGDVINDLCMHLEELSNDLNKPEEHHKIDATHGQRPISTRAFGPPGGKQSGKMLSYVGPNSIRALALFITILYYVGCIASYESKEKQMIARCKNDETPVVVTSMLRDACENFFNIINYIPAVAWHILTIVFPLIPNVPVRLREFMSKGCITPDALRNELVECTGDDDVAAAIKLPRRDSPEGQTIIQKRRNATPMLLDWERFNKTHHTTPMCSPDRLKTLAVYEVDPPYFEHYCVHFFDREHYHR